MRIIRSKTKQAEKHQELADLVCSEILKYAGLIGFDPEWRFKVKFKRLSGNLAETVVEYQYKLSDLTFDLAAILKQGKDLIGPTVRHELFHAPCWRIHEVITSLNPEMEALISKYEEELVTFLEHMPVWKDK